MIKRFCDWPVRLQRFIEQRWAQPFCSGSNDCFLFTCDAILAMTGIDLGAEVRGKYSTPAEARALTGQLTRGFGLAEYAAQLAARYGLEEADWRKLHRGDMAVVKTSEGASVCLVYPNGKLAVPSIEGGACTMLPLRLAQKGWII